MFARPLATKTTPQQQQHQQMMHPPQPPPQQMKKPKKPKKEVPKKKKKPAVKKPAPLGKPMQLPSVRAGNAFSIFVKERPFPPGQTVSERIKEISQEWKLLPQVEKDRYATLASHAKEEAKVAYEHAIMSLTSAEIRAENQLRAKLRKKGRKSHVAFIVDPRRPKRPLSAYLLYCQERREAGDVSGMAAVETLKSLASAWKQLEPEEKLKYENRAAHLAEDYKQQWASYTNTN